MHGGSINRQATEYSENIPLITDRRTANTFAGKWLLPMLNNIGNVGASFSNTHIGMDLAAAIAICQKIINDDITGCDLRPHEISVLAAAENSWPLLVTAGITLLYAAPSIWTKCAVTENKPFPDLTSKKGIAALLGGISEGTLSGLGLSRFINHIGASLHMEFGVLNNVLGVSAGIMTAYAMTRYNERGLTGLENLLANADTTEEQHNTSLGKIGRYLWQNPAATLITCLSLTGRMYPIMQLLPGSSQCQWPIAAATFTCSFLTSPILFPGRAGVHFVGFAARKKAQSEPEERRDNPSLWEKTIGSFQASTNPGLNISPLFLTMLMMLMVSGMEPRVAMGATLAIALPLLAFSGIGRKFYAQYKTQANAIMADPDNNNEPDESQAFTFYGATQRPEQPDENSPDQIRSKA